ncbi:MAG: serine/threonine protein kinase [Thermomicrobium sp.]|nr:serine/threonine protein kinase [Thermomicrobium sp.]
MLEALPTVIAGRYRVEAPLGHGGMATTYLARDLVLDRPVAVKVLRTAGPSAPDPARFEREARAAAAVSHPNVVQVYDAGQDGELRYIVLEWVDGGDLARLIRERAPLPVDEVVRIGLDIVQGLAAIHRAGIVHRDVKPANVLLDRHGRAKLTDFGIARRSDDPTLTGPAELLGTAAYVAPERVRGEPATAASDLYAVGVVLYELLTGRLPYPGETPEELLAQHLHAAPLPLRRWRRDVPPALEQVVLRALAKDPAARFRSAEAMAAALQAAGRSGSTGWRPAGAARDPSVAARSRSLALAGGATVLSLAVVVVLALLAWAQLAGSELPAPTPTPQPAGVTEPLATATAAPSPAPTATPVATPTPTPTPTPVPTPPAAAVLFGTLEVVPATPPELRRFTGTLALEFGPEEVTGAYLPYRDGALPGFTRDLANAALLFGRESGSVQLVVPSGTERLLIEVEGRASRGEPKAALEILLGSRVVWRGEDPFPGPTWTTRSVVLAFDRLPGEVPVTLTIRNAGEPGGRGTEPWLAIRSVRIRAAD